MRKDLTGEGNKSPYIKDYYINKLKMKTPNRKKSNPSWHRTHIKLHYSTVFNLKSEDSISTGQDRIWRLR